MSYSKLHQKRLVVLLPFIKELSLKFNRDESDIVTNGLYSNNFDKNVRLIFEDGSYIYYKGAFLIKNNEQVGVFTEHCGYHLYNLDDFDEYDEDAPYAPIYPSYIDE